MAKLLYCLLGLLVHSTLQQPHVEIQMAAQREGNTLHLTCMVTPSPLLENEGIDFFLNSMPVGNFADLRITRFLRSIDVTIDPRHEGFWKCILYDITGVTIEPIAASNTIGPIAANPRYSVNQSVPLFYVGFVGSKVSLLPVVPPGASQNLYTYTWSNGTNHDVSGMEGFLQNDDRSLSIAPLKASHNGSYSLVIQVNGWPTSFTYRNDSYRLQVQEIPHFNNMGSSIVVITNNEAVDQVITCSVQGYPDVDIEWRHNNQSIRNDQKYQIAYVTRNVPYTDNSTLLIRNVNATDNGVVSCIASTNGCNVALSRGSCYNQVFREQLDTKLSIITGEFQYTVMVLSGKNMELRLQLKGRPIPEAIRVHVQYIDVESGKKTVVTSDGSYTNLLHIPIFVPYTAIPAFTRFRITVALGTDTEAGPFRSPIKDIVYDINVPDVSCDKQRLYQVLAIAIPCVLGAIVTTTIMALIIQVICLKKSNTKLKIKVGETVDNNADNNKSPREKAEEFREIFKITYRTVRDGVEESSFYVDRNVQVKMVTQLGLPRVVTDDAKIQESPVSITGEWIKTTDRIFSAICDPKKKSDLMHHLYSVIREEDLLPKRSKPSIV